MSAIDQTNLTITPDTILPGASKGFTMPAKRLIADRTNWLCFYCGAGLKEPSSTSFNLPDVMTVDHIIPRACGGLDEFQNLAPACRRCNSSKGNRTIERWRLVCELHQAGVPRFSEKQVDWLQENGFEFELPHYEFWFEKNGFRITESGSLPLYIGGDK